MNTIDQPKLPAVTTNTQQAFDDLRNDGIGLLAGALPTSTISRLRQSVEQLAIQERTAGTAFLEDGNLNTAGDNQANQRVFNLIGKGEVFQSLAQNPIALRCAAELFAEGYGIPEEIASSMGLNHVLLSSLTANMAGKGGVPMLQHADQAFAPPNTTYPMVLNVAWLLTDFTVHNGATLVAPGSHKAQNPFEYFLQPPATTPVIAPAGTALLLDGRTWHGTGANTTDQPRIAIFAYYCRPFLRQQENFQLTLSSQQKAALSPELQELLGFQVWFTLGGIGGTPNGERVGIPTPT